MIENRSGLQQPLVERSLREFNCIARPVRQPGSHLHGFIGKLVIRYAHADQSDALCFTAIDEIARHQVVFRFGHAA